MPRVHYGRRILFGLVKGPNARGPSRRLGPLSLHRVMCRLESDLSSKDQTTAAQTIQSSVSIATGTVGVSSTAGVEEVVAKRSIIGKVQVGNNGVRNAKEHVVEQIVDLRLESQ